MQYHNNDMDELFRKAAEAYPLNTGSANWEAVQAALAGEEKQDPKPKPNLRWLFVILPFLLLGLHLNRAIVTGRTRTAPAEMLSQSTMAPRDTDNRGTERSAVPHAGSASPEERLYRQSSSTALLRLPSFWLATSQPYQNPTANQDAGTEETMVYTPPLTAASRTTAAAATTETPALTRIDDHAPKISADAQPEVNKFLTDTSSNRQSVEEANPRKAKALLSLKRFYVGIVGGPDISTVKFNRFSKVGFSAGILAGYSLNDRLAVEAGVLTSEKHYYSDGAHYKSDGYYSPSYAKLVAVDGSCRMFEIPVALRYTLSRKKAHTWFATAGVSSYIMQREDYDLDYFYPSSGSIATHKHTYTEKEQYWLTALQLSLGYSTKLGSLGNLRIEPYYALPLKGMGHGSLPVSSFGLRLGVTFPQF